MYPKSRDLEIVYNLFWRSRTHHSDEVSNIVGMHDIPSTTLNLEIFKSYLLKNSGCNASDIKVSYIDFTDREIPINNQNDFQLALYSFRRQARIGEIVRLRVDKLDENKSGKKLTPTTDAEIQTQEFKDIATQPGDVINADNPPNWFKNYMQKFEQKIMMDLQSQFEQLTRELQKTKDSRSVSKSIKLYKRSDPTRYILNCDEDKPFHTENEEHLKARMQNVMYEENALTHENTAFHYFATSALDIDPQMLLNDVRLISSSSDRAGHLLPNAIYKQVWHVANTGQTTWDDKTELRYAWGSEKLRPLETILKCPKLRPGDTGDIEVLFDIPEIPGRYDCYWHFYDSGRRFGHWIGCEITVSNGPLAFCRTPSQDSLKTRERLIANGISAAKSNAFKTDLEDDANDNRNSVCDTTSIISMRTSEKSGPSDYSILRSQSTSPELIDLPTSTSDVPKVSPTSTNEINQTLLTSTTAVDEVPETEFHLDTDGKKTKTANEEDGEYVYVYYDGKKYNSLVKSEASEVTSEANSASSSVNTNKRLFVFPRQSPGFEVVYPGDRLLQSISSSSDIFDDLTRVDSTTTSTVPIKGENDDVQFSDLDVCQIATEAIPANDVIGDDNKPQEKSIVLRLLNEMGFCNDDVNRRLLAENNNDIEKVISELLK